MFFLLPWERERCELEGWMRSWQLERTIALFESLNVIDVCRISWWSAAGYTWLTVHRLPELTQCFINFFFQVPKWVDSFTIQLKVTLKCCTPLMCKHKYQISPDVLWDLFHTKHCQRRHFGELVIWTEQRNQIRRGKKCFCGRRGAIQVL